jgi:hypothetical protein
MPFKVLVAHAGTGPPLTTDNIVLSGRVVYTTIYMRSQL